jgi:glycosyltransferase involved in cell wall biosynthesis
MIHERYDEIRAIEKKISDHKRLLAQKASKVIAISENTKRDIIRYFDVDEKKIDVVYLGNSITPISLPQNRISVPNKYMLYVGVRSFYKNFQPFLASVVSSLAQDEELYLLCAGGGDFSGDEISLFRKFGIHQKVIHHPVSDDILGHLYRNARVFVFPSLYEGFGIPVLEAFACGCPAVLSDASSLPEIAMGAALYFNPADENSIRETVEKVLYDETVRKELIAKGYERVKEFSWEKTARETRKIYESLL